MSKCIVLCFDGSGATPAEEGIPKEHQRETNVSRFYKSIAVQGAGREESLRWYHAGVGTGDVGKWLGLGMGAGLELQVVQGYAYLAEHYAEGDRIYLLGFSRGAYAARSLAGMIDCCGLIENTRFLEAQAVEAARIYRRAGGTPSEEALAFKNLHAREVAVHFLGVWDTVGALGIPAERLEGVQERLYGFHNVDLSRIVEHACHAMALDEHRQEFDICRWTPNGHTLQEQRWFAGAHSDIGGGYRDRRLSDIALRWMQDHAAAAGLDLILVEVDSENYLAPIETPPHLGDYDRAVLAGEALDESLVKKIHDDASYAPDNPGLQEALARRSAGVPR